MVDFDRAGEVARYILPAVRHNWTLWGTYAF